MKINKLVRQFRMKLALKECGISRAEMEGDEEPMVTPEEEETELEQGLTELENGLEEEPESASSRVAEAIKRSAEMPHFKNAFLTRNPGAESEGSVFKEPQTTESLMSAGWEPYDHPDVSAPAVAFKANIPGTFGIVNLSDLDPRTPVEMMLGHKGEDEFVNALVDKQHVPDNLTESDFTTILLGPDEGGEIVWTFFPGPPVMPSTTEPSGETESAQTVEDAISLGFEYAKVKGA